MTMRRGGNNDSIFVAIATVTPGYLSRVELSSTDIPKDERKGEKMIITLFLFILFNNRNTWLVIMSYVFLRCCSNWF